MRYLERTSMNTKHRVAQSWNVSKSAKDKIVYSKRKKNQNVQIFKHFQFSNCLVLFVTLNVFFLFFLFLWFLIRNCVQHLIFFNNEFTKTVLLNVHVKLFRRKANVEKNKPKLFQVLNLFIAIMDELEFIWKIYGNDHSSNKVKENKAINKTIHWKYFFLYSECNRITNGTRQRKYALK